MSNHTDSNSQPKASSRKSKGRSSTAKKPPLSKSEQIKALLAQGLGVTEISKRLKVSRTLVYRAKGQLKANEAAKPKRIHLSEVREQQCQLKAADFFRANSTDIEVEKYECSHCGRPMWGDDPKKNDLCEDCAIQFMHEAQAAQVIRSQDRFVNPFADQSNARTIELNFRGDYWSL